MDAVDGDQDDLLEQKVTLIITMSNIYILCIRLDALEMMMQRQKENCWMHLKKCILVLMSLSIHDENHNNVT